MDIEFIEQLVDSMEESVLKLEKALKRKKVADANKLKVAIFDLQNKISEALRV